MWNPFAGLGTRHGHGGGPGEDSRSGREDLAAAVAYWYRTVLRLSVIRSKYAAQAVESVRVPAHHQMALLLYGSSVAERTLARASLAAAVTAYARVQTEHALEPDAAIRATLAVVDGAFRGKKGVPPGIGALIQSLRADVIKWSRQACQAQRSVRDAGAEEGGWRSHQLFVAGGRGPCRGRPEPRAGRASARPEELGAADPAGT